MKEFTEPTFDIILLSTGDVIESSDENGFPSEEGDEQIL